MMKILLALALFVTAACNVLPEQEPVDVYQLPPPTLQRVAGAVRLSSLRIDRPLASEALSGSQLLIMPVDNQFQTFPGVRLAAPVPLLWRDWLLDAFWRDGRVGGLSASSEGLVAELELGGALRAFQIELAGTSPQAVISFDALLIDSASRNILASRRFETRQTMPSTAVAAAIDALGAAANELARELVAWTLEQGQ